jgi:uracil phosphoribosyltransferase
MRFRHNLERLGELFAYEISKTLLYQPAAIETPLGTKQTALMERSPVLATILRAGLPMYQGFLRFFDRAESAFIGAYRSEHTEDNSFDIIQGYTVTPNLDGKVLILIDPMLATGRSMVAVYESLLLYGTPVETHVVSVIGSEAGVKYVQAHIPKVSLWVGDIDAELNVKSYIIPGLGDAGDLAFGGKL